MAGFYNNDTGLYERADWLEDGVWIKDQEGNLYLVSGGVDDIVGPNTDTLDKLNALCREQNGDVRRISHETLKKLGLTIVPDSLKRFTPENGYYHA